jgi:SNF2 family DNA or RNA helicase
MLTIKWHDNRNIRLYLAKYIGEVTTWIRQNVFWGDRSVDKAGGFWIIKNTWAKKLFNKFNKQYGVSLDLTKQQHEILFESFNPGQAKLECQDVNLKSIVRANLYKHQESGVRFMCGVKSGILGDDMGLGKTIQAIAWAGHMKGKTLIVCPKSLVRNWVHEIKKFAVDPNVTVYTSDKGRPDATFHVVNYSKTDKFSDTLSLIPFNNIIIDESHYIKNPGSIRTKQVLSVANQIPNRLLLSGTAIKNRLAELFTQVSLVTDTYDNFHSYQNPSRVFERYYALETNFRKLRQDMESFYIRRRKEEVLDLPDKLYSEVMVDASPKYVKAFAELLKEFKCKDAGTRNSVLGLISRMKKVCAMSKVKATTEILDNIIKQGHKALVFTDFRDVVDSLLNTFGKKAVFIDGRVSSSRKRDDAVQEFQTNPECPLFIGGIKSAGVGLNLTASSYCVFNDLAYTPADNWQAEDRGYRIGQTNTYNVYKVISEDIQFDSRINRILDRKMKLVSETLDGRSWNVEEEVKVIDEIIEEVRSL